MLSAIIDLPTNTGSKQDFSASKLAAQTQKVRVAQNPHGLIKENSLSIHSIWESPIGAPAVKQFYIKTQKRRDFLVPFAHDLACKV